MKQPRIFLLGLLSVALALTLASCLGGLHKASDRPLLGLDRKLGGDGAQALTAANGRSGGPPALYVKKSLQEIKPYSSEQAAGSLYRLDDARNDLFATYRAPDLGDDVTVLLSSNRREAAAKEDADKTQAAGGEQALASDDELAIKALPTLAPADGNKALLVKQIKMKLIQRFPNGDALAVYERRSLSDDDGTSMVVYARVPYDSLLASNQVASTDLRDISLAETNPEELIERRSTGWEDEYTMRLSGFTEAKSKYAKDLEDKRQEVEAARGKIDERVAAINKERQKLALDRDKLIKDRRLDQEKIEGLNAKISEQEGLLSNQNSSNQSTTDQLPKAQGGARPQEKTTTVPPAGPEAKL